MKKSDLVEAIADRSNLPKTQAQAVVDDVFELIADGLSRGEKIDLRGFGTFSVKFQKARTGRNPRTGESVDVDEKHVPFFKTGKLLRDRLNGEA